MTFNDGTTNILKTEYILGYIETELDDTGKVVLKDIVYNNQYNPRAVDLEVTLDVLKSDIAEGKINIIDAGKEVQKLTYVNQYGTEGDVDKALSKVKVYDSKESYNDFLVNECKYTIEEAEMIDGLHRGDGTIHMPPNSTLRAVVHESEHSLGSVRYRTNLKTNTILTETGMNESFTELIACRKTGEWGQSGYSRNVEALEAIDNIVENKGMYNALMDSYYGRDGNIYMSAVDSIAGDGFYEELAKQMEITNDPLNHTVTELEIAYGNIEQMVNNFIQVSGAEGVFEFKYGIFEGE